MGKPTGFLEYKRAENAALAPRERVNSFDEFRMPMDEEERRKQGARCMNCGVPFCQSAIRYSGKLIGCPLHNLIPEWNDEIYNGNYSHAIDRLLKTNNFPEFTGRVCPGLCERACIEGKYDAAVSVHENELFVIETAFKNNYIRPKTPAIRSGKSVAVVGSGPAGLACADQLNHRGHSVTVYEKSDRIGGLLMYGIPNMKLDKSIIDRRVKLMQEEGVEFIVNTAVGVCTDGENVHSESTAAGRTDGDSEPCTGSAAAEGKAAVQKYISASELMSKYDAVVLCCGAEIPRPLEAWDKEKAEGRDIAGVYYAMDYLTAATRHLLDGTPEISAKGLNVVVVGAGDTGNDCIATAVRQGAASITQIVRKSAPDPESPAPVWPDYDESSRPGYGQEEAIAVYGHDPRVYSTGVKSLRYDEQGRLNAVEVIRLNRVDGKYQEIAGTESYIPCELLIVASGFKGCDMSVPETFGVDTDSWKSFKDHETGIEGLFTAGDMRTGATLVVRAIAEGRDCASRVDEYLVGYRVLERL